MFHLSTKSSWDEKKNIEIDLEWIETVWEKEENQYQSSYAKIGVEKRIADGTDERTNGNWHVINISIIHIQID